MATRVAAWAWGSVIWRSSFSFITEYLAAVSTATVPRWVASIRAVCICYRALASPGCELRLLDGGETALLLEG